MSYFDAVAKVELAREELGGKIATFLSLVLHDLNSGRKNIPITTPFNPSLVRATCGAMFVTHEDKILYASMFDPLDVKHVTYSSPHDTGAVVAIRRFVQKTVFKELTTGNMSQLVAQLTSPLPEDPTPIQLALNCMINMLHVNTAVMIIRNLVQTFGVGNIFGVTDVAALVEIIVSIRVPPASAKHSIEFRRLLAWHGIHVNISSWSTVPQWFNDRIVKAAAEAPFDYGAQFIQDYSTLMRVDIPMSALRELLHAFVHTYDYLDFSDVFPKAGMLAHMLSNMRP